ncbi:MAG: hypothetical protein RML38_11020, partial [Bacteroidia bacterium]|nr:hypothetical protein [Bacteroidia bacterium]
DMIAKVNCVRGMEHADRQCVALAKHRSDSVVRNAPTLASARGTPKKIKSFSDLIQLWYFVHFSTQFLRSCAFWTVR